MSDPLATSTIALDALALSSHALKYKSQAEILKGLPAKEKYKDPGQAAAALREHRVDVLLLPARVMKSDDWLGVKEDVEKFRKDGEVYLASSTMRYDVRAFVPRLYKVMQEFVDATPTLSVFPGTRAAAIKAASTKALAGGGVHLSFGRVLEHAPKLGAVIADAPTRAEVDAALQRLRRDPARDPPKAYALEWSGEPSVKINADADNGFPVGGTMREDYPRQLTLELAGNLRGNLQGTPNLAAAVAAYRSRFPEFFLVKGKTKLDPYTLDKLNGQKMRLYGSVPRHLVLIMQQATQPLSERWKRNAEESYRSFIGRGMANGGAEALVDWLDFQVVTDDIGWSHCGDDTFMVRHWQNSDGQHCYAMFSLDCTAFDLTQHGDVTRHIHEAFADQLRAIDALAAEIWLSMMRMREITLSGALPVRTKHWGASGMPMQSEVNDVLMEILCSRLARESWHTRAELEAHIVFHADRLGLKVRLEHFWETKAKSLQHAPVHYCLARQPFLYVGYHLYQREGEGRVAAQVDVARFVSQGAYMSGAFEKDLSVLGVKVALVLAGYALSFGEPHPQYESAFGALVDNAKRALKAKAAEISMVDAQAELDKYVYAGLGLSIKSVEGLLGALDRAEFIWSGKEPEASVSPPPPPPIPSSLLLASAGSKRPVWADEVEEEEAAVEPWLRDLRAPVRRADLGRQVNEDMTTIPSKAGRLPPTPSAELRLRAALKQAKEARNDPQERAHARRAGSTNFKRAGVFYEDGQ